MEGLRVPPILYSSIDTHFASFSTDYDYSWDYDYD